MRVLADPDEVVRTLHPLRRRILAALDEPGSATSVAAELGVPRQKVNYHLRELEALGVVRLVEERARRGLTERIVARVDDHVLVDPLVTDTSGARLSPSAHRDVDAALAATAQAGSDLRRVAEAAAEAGQRVPTATVAATVRFATPDALRAFTAELADLIARHDAADAEHALAMEFAAVAYPTLTEPSP